MPDLVQGLIDPGTQTWNQDLVMRCFNGEEAQKVLLLPTSRWGCEDKMIWHFTVHGGYSMRSGKAEGKGSGDCGQKSFWESIWRLPTGFRNALAVKENLRRQRVDVGNTSLRLDVSQIEGADFRTSGSMGGLQGSMALVMEAKAIREALLTCSDLRLLMQMLKGERPIDVAVEAIIFDIKTLASLLKQVVFMDTPR
ncbi:hypothetical protein ACE6H2_010432 [Prunus campanulata]